MINDKPYKHGRDHRPGGPDPAQPGTAHLVGTAGEPAFQNAIVNVGGSSVPLQFLIVTGRPNLLSLDGTTILQYQPKVLAILGDFTGGAEGDTVFNLPLAYRLDHDVPVATHDDAGVYRPCRLYVNGDFVQGVP